MDLEIEGERRKTKIIGIRLFKEEYDLVSSIAKKKGLSRSFVAESFTRAAIREWRKNPATESHLAKGPDGG
jgi:hypothetical protein